LAAHNRSGIAEFFLGSVCKYVVANACIPVCVINTAPQIEETA
jgi:nucleotide-binding universal stress UspA family protein